MYLYTSTFVVLSRKKRFPLYDFYVFSLEQKIANANSAIYRMQIALTYYPDIASTRSLKIRNRCELAITT